VEPIIATRDRNTGILPVRLADILSAYPKQRSATPLGAQTESLCSGDPSHPHYPGSKLFIR